ncbi:hypothetical protein [Thiomonas sp. FB-Cd]|uniref:hypothetical protein n=1 Tax=Thiomonas sp. FB-Cd TaxID=1158292 RepID=UPI0004DF80A6|nr:hypothetical protein [Thiomonas sp. FB-Cd]
MGTSSKEIHSTHSTLRERIVEHVFVGEMLRSLWRRGIVDVEILRSEFDAHGYDLVIARGDVVRHIQFKTGTANRPGKVSVPLALSGKPAGGVLWIHVNDGLDLGPFFWFDGPPGEPLPPLGPAVPRRATHNSQGERPPRANHREIQAGRFDRLETVEEVLVALLGDLTP